MTTTTNRDAHNPEDNLSKHFMTTPIYDQVVRDYSSVELQIPFKPLDVSPQVDAIGTIYDGLITTNVDPDLSSCGKPLGVLGKLSIAASVVIFTVSGFAYWAGWTA